MTDVVIVFGYLLLTLVLGIWVGRNVGSAEDYKTGGRKYPAWVIFATLSASFIGGGFTLGLAEKTFIYGLIYVVAILGFSLKEILIALIIAPRMQAFRSVTTIGDIMEQAFGRNAKIITGVASVLVCGGIIGAQISACGSIIHTFLGPPPAIGALLAASIVIIYSTLGGMRSVVAVDILHFGVFTITIPLVLFFALQEVGGTQTFIQTLSETKFDTSSTIDLKAFLVLFLSFFLGETLIPPYIQRLLIGKTGKSTQYGTFWSGIFSIFFFAMIGCIGMAAFILAPHIASPSALPYVIQMVMPVGLKGLAIAAMLAVIMSSVDSFLNSISISCAHDVLKPLGIMRKTKNSELLLSRMVTLVIGTIAIVISLNLSSSIDILLYSYQFWTPFILTPFVAAIFGVRSNSRAFIISALTGIAGVVFWSFITTTQDKSVMDGALEGTIFGICLNILVFVSYRWICGRGQNIPALQVSTEKT